METRFWSKVDASGVCWEWTAAKAGKGYGKYSVTANGKTTYPYAHRYAWESLVGPISDDMTIDHQCKNRLCVNPDHLEVVTRAVNSLRGESPVAHNARKTHCPKGHEYSTENARVGKQGYRTCRACHRIYDSNRRKAVA